MGRLAQTLAITQYTYLHWQKSLLVVHKFGFRNVATLRRRLEASSWLALRAMAQSARPVQSVATQSVARRGYPAMLNLDEKLSIATGGGQLQDREDKQSSQPSNSEHVAQFPAPATNSRTKGKRKVSNSGGCVLRNLQVQCKRLLASTLCSVAKALANPSLNRTLCGGPRLAIIHSWPNPAHRKVPVSSNVRPQRKHSAVTRNSRHHLYRWHKLLSTRG